MTQFLKVLRLIKPYWGKTTIHFLLNLLYIGFSLFSLTMVIPVMQLLFGEKSDSYEEMAEKAPASFEFSASALEEYLQHFLARIIVNSDNGRFDALYYVCLAIVVLFFLKGLTLYLSKYVLAAIRSNVVRDLRAKAYTKALWLPMEFHSEKRKGDIMSRLSNDIQEVEQTFMNNLMSLFRDPIHVLIFFVSLIFISPQLTLLAVILLPVAAYLIGYIGRSLKRTSRKTQVRMGRIMSLIEETLGGMRIIKAFNGEHKFREKFDHTNEEYAQLMTKKFRRKGAANPLSEFLGAVVLTVILWFGGSLVLSEELSASVFLGYVVIFSQMIAPAKSFTNTFYSIQRGMASFNRVDHLIGESSRVYEKKNAISVKGLQHGIEYKNVRFHYNQEPVLSDINFRVGKGRSVALVGHSGAGKSTLVDLLPRFYDPVEGEILLDGTNIQDFKVRDLRDLLGVVTQESILFNDSILNNIAFGKPNADRQEIKEAAEVANAHDFITKFEEGYDTNIGDGGNKLSGGQKQRISIARAVLKNPPVLILDEATSALDTESERLVQEALFNLMENRTSIVIAHRLSTIQYADEILVMEGGRIVERGDHDELLQKGGQYERLSRMQSVIT